jgi:hypothetical protein
MALNALFKNKVKSYVESIRIGVVSARLGAFIKCLNLLSNQVRQRKTHSLLRLSQHNNLIERAHRLLTSLVYILENKGLRQPFNRMAFTYNRARMFLYLA